MSDLVLQAFSGDFLELEIIFVILAIVSLVL
jgi:hypothetical protein